MSRTVPNSRYYAFGLLLDSEIPLPELLPADDLASPADITLRRGSLDLPDSYRSHGRYTRVDDTTAYLYWNRIGAFRIRRGAEIVVDPLSGVGDDPLRPLILGPVMGALLHQGGKLVLHGSAIRLREREDAVAFLAHTGKGKSTTVSALQMRGHGFVTDDLTVLQLNENASPPMIWPGYPRCKLRPEALEPLGLKEEDLPRLPLEERRSQAMDHYDPRPARLKRLVVLDEGPTTEMRPLSRQEAVIELARYSYMAQHLTPTEMKRNLEQLANVAARVPVIRFTRPLDSSQLRASMDTLESELSV